MNRETKLRALSDRTRELVDELSIARQDVLSVADLNRAMQQILRNQLAILEEVAGLERSSPLENSAAQTRQAARPAQTLGEVHGRNVDQNGSGAYKKPPVISLREKEAASSASATPTGTFVDPHAEEVSAPASQPTPVADERDDPRNRDLTGVSPMKSRELETMLDEIDDTKSLAEKILNESRELMPSLARVFVEEFDNRDKMYDKGLEKLNRWVAGGQAGTPFQWRGDRAYLNLNGAGPAGVRKYEEQLMKRMGFSRRLGRLVVPELRGEIVVYERP